MKFRHIFPLTRAQKFVNIVHRELREGWAVAILGEVGSANSNERYGWPEMRSLSFRLKVLDLLEADGLVTAKSGFSAPDTYDEWTFAAYPKEEAGRD